MSSTVTHFQLSKDTEKLSVNQIGAKILFSKVLMLNEMITSISCAYTSCASGLVLALATHYMSIKFSKTCQSWQQISHIMIYLCNSGVH